MLEGLGACPVKIMILEVRVLLINFDSSVIFKTLYLALNKLIIILKSLGRGKIWTLGGYPGPPPPPPNQKSYMTP